MKEKSKEIEKAFGEVITKIGAELPNESSIQDLAIETVAQLNAMTFIITTQGTTVTKGGGKRLATKKDEGKAK